MSSLSDPVRTLDSLREHLQDGAEPRLTIRGSDHLDMAHMPYFQMVMAPARDVATYRNLVAPRAQARLVEMGGVAAEAAARVGNNGWLNKQRPRILASQHTVARLIRQSFTSEPQLIDPVAWNEDSQVALGLESLTQIIEVEALLGMPARQANPLHPGVFFSPEEVLGLVKRATALGIGPDNIRGLAQKYRHAKPKLEADLARREAVAAHKLRREAQRRRYHWLKGDE